ncbi:MAG: pyridoxal-phosphate dependent enzyme, partial [Chloroflexi bacterium]|nr:pyridoxal-phosphate dependent enzyme [Chloroflexota bacterium]
VLGARVESPKTIATAIRIGNPASWKGAEAARDESGGTIDSVTDEEIIEAYKVLASTEGIFVEPASAASVAGLMKLCRHGLHLKNSVTVCVLTGTGLKDPDTAARYAEPRMVDLPPELDAVERVLRLTSGHGS